MRVGTITLPWADGEYPFRLGIGEWRELYRKLLKEFLALGMSEEMAMNAATPLMIGKRLSAGNPIPGEVGEVMFQALVGGGMKAQEATALRRRYVDDRDRYLESVPVAQAIALTALMGPPEPDEKKAGAEEAPSSPSADSTKTAQVSDIRRKRSTK